MTKLNFRSNFDEYMNDEYLFTYNAISVRGERHQRINQENQDFFTCNIRKEVKYLIVADGVGSALHSQKGAEKAVTLLEQMIVESLHNLSNVSESVMNTFYSKFRDNWKKCFPKTYYDYDTTLRFVLIFKHGVFLGSIGDGMVISSTGKSVVYLKEERDSFSNQTYSLASDHAENQFKSKYIPFDTMNDLPIVVILMTDGVADDLKSDRLKQLPIYLYQEIKVKGVIRMQKEISDWIINWKTNNHSDDRTFCMFTMSKGDSKDEA